MNWLKKHADTLAILGSFAVCFWNLNEKMNDKFNAVDNRFSVIEKDVAIIKTVMIMNHHMPCELVSEKNLMQHDQ